jgi:hypothetical protein
MDLRAEYDGFRALLFIGMEHPGFMSRKANAFARFSKIGVVHRP